MADGRWPMATLPQMQECDVVPATSNSHSSPSAEECCRQPATVEALVVSLTTYCSGTGYDSVLQIVWHLVQPSNWSVFAVTVQYIR